MMMGMKIDGRSLLSKTLHNGSKTAYATKKMVRVALYFQGLLGSNPLISFSRPAILALPMLVRSRKDTR